MDRVRVEEPQFDTAGEKIGDFFANVRPARVGTPIALPDPAQPRTWLPRERFPDLVEYFVDLDGNTFHVPDRQGNLHLVFRVEQQDCLAAWNAEMWMVEWERTGEHRFSVTLVIHDQADDPLRVPFGFSLEQPDQAHDAAQLIEQEEIPIYLLVAMDGGLGFFDRRVIHLPDEFRRSLGRALRDDFRKMAQTAQAHSGACETLDALAAGAGVLVRHTDVSREQVESGDTSSVLALIAAREEEARRRHPGSQIMAFSVSGYDDDPRELFQIPEVRRWFTVLDEAVPHLLYFLSPHGGLPMMYAASLLQPEWDATSSQVSFDPDALVEFLDAKLSAIGLYCWEHSLDPCPVAASVADTYGVSIDAQAFYAALTDEMARQTQVLEEQVSSEAERLKQYTRLAADADGETRVLLGMALGGAPESAQKVVEALSRVSWDTAEILAEAIPWFGQAAVPHLLKTAYGKKKSTIYCSLRALSHIGGPEALDVLCQRFEDLPTKGEAIEGLIDIGPSAVPRIVDYTTHGQAEIRRLAAYALGKMGVRVARELLQAMATSDRSSAVRDMAEIALTWLGGEPCDVNLRGLMPVIELKREMSQ
jgi:hypothetical protein